MVVFLDEQQTNELILKYELERKLAVASATIELENWKEFLKCSINS
jgi:hypothetical protein